MRHFQITVQASIIEDDDVVVSVEDGPDAEERAQDLALRQTRGGFIHGARLEVVDSYEIDRPILYGGKRI